MVDPRNGSGLDDAQADQRPPSPLAAFATDGLPGLLGALGGASFEETVDDPEALRRAEDAVAGRTTPGARANGSGARRIDEAWTIVATQVIPGDNAGLEDVVRALEGEEVDFGWDPYDPRDSVNFGPPGTGPSARKLFTVMVPASQFARARGVLYGEPPQGVTYSWGGETVSGTAPAAPNTASEFDFEPPTLPQRTATRDGVPLSDNERFSRQAGGTGRPGQPAPAGNPGLSTIGRVLVLVGVLGILAAIASMLLERG